MGQFKDSTKLKVMKINAFKCRPNPIKNGPYIEPKKKPTLSPLELPTSVTLLVMLAKVAKEKKALENSIKTNEGPSSQKLRVLKILVTSTKRTIQLETTPYESILCFILELKIS